MKMKKQAGKKINQGEISSILKRDTKILDKNTQRAELMSRNEKFLKELDGITKILGKEFFAMRNRPEEELWKISKKNILHQLDYPKIIDEKEKEMVAGVYIREQKYFGYYPWDKKPTALESRN